MRQSIHPILTLWLTAPLIRLQVADRFGQCGVIGHPLVDQPDNADMVDEISDATAAVQLADRAVICDQRKAEPEFGGEPLVRLQRVCTYAQNLGVKLFKVGYVPLKSLHFLGSARCEIGIIDGKNHRPLLNELAKHDLPHGR